MRRRFQGFRTALKRYAENQQGTMVERDVSIEMDIDAMEHERTPPPKKRATEKAASSTYDCDK